MPSSTLLRTLVAAASAVVLLLALLAAPAAAQSADVTPTLYTGSDKYKYQGCYNETVDIPNSARDRALAGGVHKTMDGTMTAPLCLSYCNDNGLRFAGVEYSRECWCSQYLSGLAVKLPDSECDLPCDGNKAMVCGGAWKLSVYAADLGTFNKNAAPLVPAGGLWTAVLSLVAAGYALL